MSKLMDAVEKQVLRGYVLKVCEKAEPLGAGTEVITGALKAEGFTCKKDDVAEACSYLESKGLVTVSRVTNEVLRIERSISKITAKGIDLLEGTITESGIELS